MPYVTQTEVKQYLGVTWTSGLDSLIDTFISAGEKYVEKITGRVFEDDDTDKTKYFDGNGKTRLPVFDIRAITSLTVDGVSLTENDDYYAYPLNATDDDEPYTNLQLLQPETRLNANSRIVATSPYIFEEAQRNITLVGKFGYSVTPPDDIKTVVMKVVGGLIKENIGDADLREVTAESLGEYSASYAKISEIANRLGIGDLLAQYIGGSKKRSKNISGIIQVS